MKSKIYLHESFHNYARTIFSMLNVTPVASELQKSTIEYIVEGEYLNKDVYEVHVTLSTKYGKIISAKLCDIEDITI